MFLIWSGCRRWMDITGDQNPYPLGVLGPAASLSELLTSTRALDFRLLRNKISKAYLSSDQLNWTRKATFLFPLVLTHTAAMWRWASHLHSELLVLYNYKISSTWRFYTVVQCYSTPVQDLSLKCHFASHDNVFLNQFRNLMGSRTISFIMVSVPVGDTNPKSLMKQWMLYNSSFCVCFLFFFYSSIIAIQSYAGFKYTTQRFNSFPYYQILTLSSVITIIVVKCYRIINCILHAVLPSLWPTYIVIVNNYAP